MASWAAVASRGAGRQAGAHDQDDGNPSAAGEQQRGRAAARPQDPLLLQALLSRPDVTGERRCLGCGRAFRDLQRFAQHLKDAHGGINVAGLPPPPGFPSGSSSSAGRAGPGPSLRSAVQLGDILLRSRPATPGKQPRRQQQAAPRQQLQAQAQQQQAGRSRPASRSAALAALPAWPRAPPPPPAPAAPIAAASTHKAAPTLTPPPGTRQRRQRKRESQLKRAFRRSKAAQACARWQGVLAELETALQAVGEAQGCLANQRAAVQRQLAEAASQRQPLEQQQQADLRQANLSVQLQVLERQQQHAEECRHTLERAHERARAQLAAAQQELQRQEGSVPPEADAGSSDAAGADAISQELGSSAAGQGSQPQQEQVSSAPAAAVAAKCADACDATPAAEERPMLEQQQAAPAADGDASEHSAAGDYIAAVDAESDAGSSVASFAFQDVLSTWATASKLPRPVLAAGLRSSTAAVKQPAAARAQEERGGQGAPAAAAAQPGSAAVLRAAAGTIAPPRASAQSPAAQPPASTAAAASSNPAGGAPSDAGSSGSSSGSSSDGSFGLQWGDQLLAWASSVKADAASVARHASQAEPWPAQQQTQQVPAQRESASRDNQQQQQPTLDSAAGQQASAAALPPAGPAAEEATAAVTAAAARPSSGVDVSAWLGSHALAAAAEGAQLEQAPPLLQGDAAPGSSVRSTTVSTVAACAGSDLAAAAAGAGFLPGNGEEGRDQPAFVQPAEGAPGAFLCLVCQVTVSGPRNLQEHLSSKRHLRRVAAQAAASADAQQGLGQAASAATGAAGAGSLAGGKGGGPGGRGGRGGFPTYTGAGADVAPYVQQVITPELNSLTEAILRRLLEWQDRARQADPANFKRKRRVVSGMREVQKAIKTRRAKLVLLAPNVRIILPSPETATTAGAAGRSGMDGGAAGAAAAGEADQDWQAGEDAAADDGEGGSDGGRDGEGESPAAALVQLAAEKEVPLVFALSRQRMGKLLGQRKRASAFAVLDPNGVFEELRRLLVLAEEGRVAWRQQHEGPR